MSSPADAFQSRIAKKFGSEIALTQSQIEGIIQLLKSNEAPQETTDKYELSSDQPETPSLIEKASRIKVLPLETYYERIQRVHEQCQHSRNVKLHRTLMTEQGLSIPEEAYRIFIEEFCQKCREDTQLSKAEKRSFSMAVQPTQRITKESVFSLPIKKRFSKLLNFKEFLDSNKKKGPAVQTSTKSILPPKKRFSLFEFSISKTTKK